MQTKANVVLLGVLGADPKVESSASSGRNFTTFSVAVDNDDTATWYRCVVFGTSGENAARLLRKGTGVQIVGELKPASIYNKNGTVRVSQNVTVSEFNIVTQPRQEVERAETNEETQLSDVS